MHSPQARDWAWRRRIRANPTSRRVYRVAVGALGATIVVVGLGLVPLPGPGWLIVFLGLGLLASEFRWAHRLHAWGMVRVRAWDSWVRRRSWVVRGALAVAAGAFLLGLLWLVLQVTGVPGWTPLWASGFLRQHLGL